MIRFVDIRNQGIPYNFSFWNTVTDSYLSIGNDYAFDNWLDVVGAAENTDTDLDRLKGLCPSWVFELEKY